MSEISKYETIYEKKKREQDFAVAKAYLDRSSAIIQNIVSPNRIITSLMEEFGLTQTGVRNILKRLNIYKDRQHPVNYPDWYQPVQAQAVDPIEHQPKKADTSSAQQPIQAVINFD